MSARRRRTGLPCPTSANLAAFTRPDRGRPGSVACSESVAPAQSRVPVAAVAAVPGVEPELRAEGDPPIPPRHLVIRAEPQFARFRLQRCRAVGVAHAGVQRPTAGHLQPCRPRLCAQGRLDAERGTRLPGRIALQAIHPTPPCNRPPETVSSMRATCQHVSGLYGRLLPGRSRRRLHPGHRDRAPPSLPPSSPLAPAPARLSRMPKARRTEVGSTDENRRTRLSVQAQDV